jgi:hypothetical protein
VRGDSARGLRRMPGCSRAHAHTAPGTGPVIPRNWPDHMLDSLPDLQIGLGRAPDVKVLLRSEGPVWGESHPVPAVIVSKTTCFSPGPGHSGPVHEDAAGFGSDSTKRTRPPSLQGLDLPPIRLRQPRELHVDQSTPLVKPTSLIKPSSLIRPSSLSGRRPIPAARRRFCAELSTPITKLEPIPGTPRCSTPTNR